MKALRVAVHGVIVALPLVVLGRFAALERPAVIACVALMVLLAEVESRARTTSDPTRIGAPGTRLALASALGLLATAWAALALPAAREEAWRWLGVPLVLSGIMLRGAAIRALGASFTSEIVAAPGHALVTRGVYARMRHPSDVGLLLVAGGVACLGGSVVAGAIVALVVTPSVLARIAREERVLARAHGDAHEAYRRAVRV